MENGAHSPEPLGISTGTNTRVRLGRACVARPAKIRQREATGGSVVWSFLLNLSAIARVRDSFLRAPGILPAYVLSGRTR